MPPHSPTSPVAQARTSCQRCHKRKKRCDRTLPQCDNCCGALVACSFLDDDRQLGSYPIAFVRGLEGRVKELEQQVAAAASSSSGAPPIGMSPSAVRPGTGSETGGAGAAMHSGLSPMSMTSASLAQELKVLSLEATAERHLGSSSGVSFAKLTQTVLRRLTPDKADFVFESVLEDDLEQQALLLPPYESPSSLLASAIFSGSGPGSSLATPAALPPFPQPLFGHISLADITDTDVSLASLPLPSPAHIRHLVDFYFAHTHTLYPIVPRAEFGDVLARVLAAEAEGGPLLAQSPLSMFRIWMVLAIGSTTYCSVTLTEESESVLYYSKALEYLEAALGYGDLAALEAIMLQVCYSFFNQLGPNTWFLVGLAARLAMGIGLHSASTYEGFPEDVVQQRKRLFFSIYMMDRVVSIALGRPFAIHDDDIDVEPFADADDEDIDATGIRTPNPLKPSLMAIPLHILRLRRIASKTARLVYANHRLSAAAAASSRRTNSRRRQGNGDDGNDDDEENEEEQIVHALHRELIDWRRAMPFPLPATHPLVPHLTSSWFDLNYYTHLSMLYRPSPLLPTPSAPRVATLADAASNALRQAAAMHRQRRFAYNWLNLLSVYTLTLALIYATTASPDSLPAVLAETGAVGDLRLAVELFGTLAGKFGAAGKIKRMVEEIIARYECLHGQQGGS